MSQLQTLRHLIRQEAATHGMEVVAPLDGRGRIAVPVDGMRWLVRPEAAFTGWGVFHVLRTRYARLLRPADPWEIEGYAARGRRLRGRVLQRPVGGTCAVLLEAPRTICLAHLVPAAEPLEELELCYDGARCWCVEVRPWPSWLSAWQDALRRGDPTGPDGTQAMHVAYGLALSLQGAAQPDLQQRVRTALQHAGASFERVSETPRGAQVRWRYRGAVHEALVRPDTLEVVSAGICLSGRDRDFDLTSLVSVMRERDEVMAGGWR